MNEAKEIVPRSEDFREMDARDEEQILLALKGTFLKEFVYKFPMGGRTVTGISWSGIKEIAYRLEGIDTEIENQSETDEAFTFIVKATNKNINSSRLGVGVQTKLMKRGGKNVTDPFAIQKALSKAQRNAIRGVIPEATIKTYIEMFSNEGRTDESTPPRREVQSETRPKPKAKPKAKAKVKPKAKSKAKAELKGNLKKQIKVMRDYGIAERTQDESDYRWSCEDVGIEDVAMTLPEPIIELLTGKLSAEPGELLALGMYQDTPVIRTQKRLTNEDWTAINTAFYDPGLRWCTGGKSSHWFAPPVETL